MIRILSQFTSSFAALLAHSTIVDLDGRVEDIRDAMLAALAPHLVETDELPELWVKISRAADAQGLWYLRSELLGHLSPHQGERKAYQTLALITEMFREIVPAEQMPKPSRLNRW